MCVLLLFVVVLGANKNGACNSSMPMKVGGNGLPFLYYYDDYPDRRNDGLWRGDGVFATAGDDHDDDDVRWR